MRAVPSRALPDIYFKEIGKGFLGTSGEVDLSVRTRLFRVYGERNCTIKLGFTRRGFEAGIDLRKGRDADGRQGNGAGALWTSTALALTFGSTHGALVHT
jgi:hypothetical protein